VEKIGGKIVIPKSQVPTVGWIAVALDPEENQIGLLQPEMP
jgi:predicted enzyme related to lactoylglutathione lyase